MYDEMTAFQDFENWYQNCLEEGIAPEDIVERMGEMKLLVSQPQIDDYERGAALSDEELFAADALKGK